MNKKKCFLIACLMVATLSAWGRDGEQVYAFACHDTVTAGIGEDTACPMFSVVKFPQALYVAQCLARDQRRLDETVLVRRRRLMTNTWSPMLEMMGRRQRFSYRQLLTLSLQQSDNNACEILFSLFGSPSQVEKFVENLGIEGIAIGATERDMMEDRSRALLNMASPRAMTELLEWFYLHKDDDEYLAFVWQTMAACATGLGRIPAAVDADDVVVHKTGTGFSTAEGIAALCDAGIVMHADGSHSTVAVFLLDHKGDTPSGEEVIARTAREMMRLTIDN